MEESYTTTQLAKKLGISRQAIMMRIKTGGFPKGGAFQLDGKGRWHIYAWAVEKAKVYAEI